MAGYRAQGWKRPLKWVVNSFAGLVIVASLMAVLSLFLFGSKLAIVQSQSMGDAMPMGALVVVDPVEPMEVKSGDIISFNPPWEERHVLVSHRVIEVLRTESLSFRTKGDANEDPDWDVVPAANVRGKVRYIFPGLGYVMSWLSQHIRNRLGFGLFVILPTALLVVGALHELRLALNPAKRRALRWRQRRAQRINRRWAKVRIRWGR